jgi:class 3 adenylate cyclase/tetratricopeptide (TPR) repeat protein
LPTERVQRQIDRLLDDAEAALTARDWLRVHDLSQDVLALDPANADARTFLDAAVRAGAGAASASPSQPAAAPEPQAPLPESVAGGRYAVRRFLGEGGRKRVYLAHDTRLARDVAVATIKTEGLDASGLSRVQREAQAMGKLGDHPNIVTIHDVGDDAGQPYIVSQYMAGGAVDGLELPLPVERTIEIAKGVCRGLAHAHGHGIIHRDLKPGNVWLSADGTAEIGDFGLAVAFEQSRLTMGGMLVGTVAYMPPEQALGGETTPRADLYSLGCMLYEMITGRPPFVSDNPTAVISQHINTPPVAPSWHSDTCPQELEDIVLRLLAKDPGERPASADDVLALLERVDPAGKAATHSDSNVLDRLALGVFVGREHELERLRKAFDNAVSGHGGLVMLVGEPGIGKTRTTQELETYAKMRGAQVLWGRTHESAGAPPYWPWIQAGNQYAAAHADDLPTVIGPQMTQEAINELVRIFPWLLQGGNVSPPEEIADPEVAQFRLFDAYAQYLRAIAHESPLVIALDDLHWADKPTLLMLQHVARELSRMRVLIVGNYRDTDITRQSALSETLASLNRESGFDRIVLRGLTRDEVGAYIKARANVEPRRDVLDRIFEETEGNAFFLSEVVNLMAQEGTLRKDSISDIAIPDGVREALGRRLNRLTEETNELLQIAAIIGRDFTYDTLTLLGDRDEDALLKMVEEALEARVIEETETAGRYRFTHAQMQETLLAELSTTRRVRLHGQVGEALEQRYGARAEERAGRLAMHFSEAATLSPRFSEKAARYSAIAGRQALAQSAYPEAARHFRAALAAREGQDMDEEMAGLLADYARASYASAEGREGWRATRQAFDYYERNGDGANAARVALVPKPGLSSISLARLLERALVLTDEDSEQYAMLLTSLGESYGTLGNDDEAAQEALNRARQIADRLDSKPLRLAILLAHVWVDGQRWRPPQRFQRATEAVALARELTDEYSEMIAHREASISCMLTTRDASREHAWASRELAERLHLGQAILSATDAQAFVAAGTGDWDAAREAATRGLDIDPRWVMLLGPMAEVELQTGNLAKAEEYQSRIQEVGQSVRSALDTIAIPVFALNKAMYCYVTGTHEGLGLVEQAGRVVLANTATTPPIWVGVGRAGLGIRAHLEGDQDAAREQLEGLDAFAGYWIHCLTIDHIRGLLFETLGQIDDAISAIETPLAHPQTGYGFRVYWSWAAYDCARIRLARNAPGDRERARALIDEALGYARTLTMRPLVDKLVALKLEDQGISTIGDIYTSIDRVASEVERERPQVSVHPAPDGTVTLMFSDIEDSTVLTERLGDQAWQELLREHNALIRTQLKAHDGYEVKTMGDGFMVAFQSAKKGLDCAIAIQRAFASTSDQSPTTSDEVKVRIGLHAGEAIREGDDFYGKNVIMASRVAGKALGGEILVSSLLRQLVESSVAAGTFADARDVELKGLGGTHTVHTVRWSAD